MYADESMVCMGSQIHAFACSGSYTNLRELLGRSVPVLEGGSLHSLGVRKAHAVTMAPVISLHLVTQVCLCLPWLVCLRRDLGGESGGQVGRHLPAACCSSNCKTSVNKGVQGGVKDWQTYQYLLPVASESESPFLL